MNFYLIFREQFTLINHFFGIISHTTVWGYPLDTTLHIIVGFIVMHLGMKMQFTFKQSFIFLIILESLKALMAAMTIDHSIWHGMKECCKRVPTMLSSLY
jgi:hypothetical protein